MIIIVFLNCFFEKNWINNQPSYISVSIYKLVIMSFISYILGYIYLSYRRVNLCDKQIISEIGSPMCRYVLL